MTSDILQHLPIRASGSWATDERHYKSKGKDMYEYGVMDRESRFILARDTSTKKFGYDATKLFQTAVDIAHMIPASLTSDQLQGYKTGFDRVMQNCKRKVFSGPIHNNSAGIQKIKTHNNGYECYNGTVKNRIKTTRGFNSNDPPLLGLFVTYYNFIRSHMGLNKKTPAEVMGIHIQGPDKWATLIAFGATH